MESVEENKIESSETESNLSQNNEKVKQQNGGDDNDGEIVDDLPPTEGPSLMCRIPYFTIEDFTKGSAQDFDEIIDVRTPLEFAEDRIIGAINLPVLNKE